MIERRPLCSERPASGSELKVSSEVTADKIWPLDAAPEASAFSPVESASSPSADVSSLQPHRQQLPRLQRSRHAFHLQQETLIIIMTFRFVEVTLFSPLSYKESVRFGPLNVLKPNILPEFASTDTTCSVTTCWQLQDGRMTVEFVPPHHIADSGRRLFCRNYGTLGPGDGCRGFEPRNSIKRRTQQPVQYPISPIGIGMCVIWRPRRDNCGSSTVPLKLEVKLKGLALYITSNAKTSQI